VEQQRFVVDNEILIERKAARTRYRYRRIDPKYAVRYLVDVCA
jgi:hypothetical protein